jgi:hypothetical protein
MCMCNLITILFEYVWTLDECAHVQFNNSIISKYVLNILCFPIYFMYLFSFVSLIKKCREKY